MDVWVASRVRLLWIMLCTFMHKCLCGQDLFSNWARLVVLKQGWFLPPRGNVAIRGESYGCHTWRRGAPGINRRDVRDATEHPTRYRAAPRQRIIPLKMLTVTKLRTPCLRGRSSTGRKLGKHWGFSFFLPIEPHLDNFKLLKPSFIFKKRARVPSEWSEISCLYQGSLTWDLGLWRIHEPPDMATKLHVRVNLSG